MSQCHSVWIFDFVPASSTLLAGLLAAMLAMEDHDHVPDLGSVLDQRQTEWEHEVVRGDALLALLGTLEDEGRRLKKGVLERSKLVTQLDLRTVDAETQRKVAEESCNSTAQENELLVRLLVLARQRCSRENSEQAKEKALCSACLEGRASRNATTSMTVAQAAADAAASDTTVRERSAARQALEAKELTAQVLPRAISSPGWGSKSRTAGARNDAVARAFCWVGAFAMPQERVLPSSRDASFAQRARAPRHACAGASPAVRAPRACDARAVGTGAVRGGERGDLP